jgi:hypothetical protein
MGYLSRTLRWVSNREPIGETGRASSDILLVCGLVFPAVCCKGGYWGLRES